MYMIQCTHIAESQYTDARHRAGVPYMTDHVSRSSRGKRGGSQEGEMAAMICCVSGRGEGTAAWLVEITRRARGALDGIFKGWPEMGLSMGGPVRGHCSRLLPYLGNFTSQDFDIFIFLHSCCADSSSPQISAILVGNFTWEDDSLRESLQFSAKVVWKISKS